MRKYRKRTYKKKKRYARKRKAPMGKSMGFPKERTVTLRYVDYIASASSIGAMSKQQFRANSIYDPNFTSTGHQPYCFDQWSLFYNHYQVISSKINVQFCPKNDNASVAPSVVGIYLSDDTTIFSDWGTIAETGRGPVKLLSAYPSDKITSLSTSFNLKKFFNRSADPGATSALVSTNPTEEAYFNIWYQAMDQAATTPVIQGKVTIDYKVRFFEPKDLTGS